jgi:hypothetical protein
MAVADAAEAGPIVVRRDDDAAGAGDALDEKGGDVVGALKVDDLLDVGDALPGAGVGFLAKDAAIAEGVKDADDAGSMGKRRGSPPALMAP